MAHFFYLGLYFVTQVTPGDTKDTSLSRHSSRWPVILLTFFSNPHLIKPYRHIALSLESESFQVCVKTVGLMGVSSDKWLKGCTMLTRNFNNKGQRMEK